MTSKTGKICKYYEVKNFFTSSHSKGLFNQLDYKTYVLVNIWCLLNYNLLVFSNFNKLSFILKSVWYNVLYQEDCGRICAKDTPICMNNYLNKLYSNPKRYICQRLEKYLHESWRFHETISQEFEPTGYNNSTKHIDRTLRWSSQHFCFVFARSLVIPAPKTAYVTETFRSFLRYLQTRTEIEKLHHKHFLYYLLIIYLWDNI